MPNSTKRLALIALLASTGLTQPAFALDADAFAERLSATVNAMGTAVTLSEPQPIGDDGVRFETVTLAYEGVDEAGELTFSIEFSGIIENADGSYYAEQGLIPAFTDSHTEEGETVEISVGEIELNRVHLPAGEITPIDTITSLEEMVFGPISISVEGNTIFGIEEVYAVSTFEPPLEEGAVERVLSDYRIGGIAVDLEAIGDEDSLAMIEVLGVTRLELDIDAHTDWTMSDGHIVLDDFTFALADLGTLEMMFDFTGFTSEFLQTLYDSQSRSLAALQAGDQEAYDAEQMQLGMAFLQNLNLGGARIRYEDASLVPKLLELGAADAEMSRDEFVAGMVQTLPLMLADSPLPALNEQIETAVAAFLEDPQSFEIALAPASPLGLLVVMGAAASPEGLVSLLQPSITANQ